MATPSAGGVPRLVFGAGGGGIYGHRDGLVSLSGLLAVVPAGWP
jgi:hypothetical protein